MLHLHRADRADALVAALGGLLATPPADPFAPELIAVPTRGIERWLTQRLAGVLGAGSGRADGIVANVALPSPPQLIRRALTDALGHEAGADPWSAERTLWPLLEVVDEALAEPWLALLADHLRDSAGHGADEHRPPRRLVAVRHIAALYDRYALHRPDLLAAWARGEDVDGAGAPLGPAAWQAELWRRLCARIEGPDPAERLALAAHRIAAAPEALDLPARLAVFGLTRLAPAHLTVLRALAVGRDVHLLLLHPSPALWAKVAADADADADADDDDDGGGRAPGGAGLAVNRLLASWGRDAQALQLVLGAGAEDHLLSDGPTVRGEAAAPRASTLLARLQADVRADRRAPGPPPPDARDTRPPLDADDRSLELHACHGRARQVEVLRDVVLGALADDPTLEPRDVIVMCPDIEAFAPLIQATFGTADDADGGDLRVRLADRALRQTNPLLGTLARLLELADGRLAASDVLDLADRGPVRRRFGFGDDDLARLEGWVADGQIRWGLDAAHRAPYRLQDVAQNTWRAGLDRLLAGVAVDAADRAPVGATLPLDDVGGDAELAGRLAEFGARLATVVHRFERPHTAAGWADELALAADLLCAAPPAEAWQRAALDRLLGELTEGAAGGRATLALDELRALLADALAGRPTRANFRTGHLTVCTLSPMRAVPHRVVCLIGLDDGAFPRKAPRDGDDLVLAVPRLGDPDGRSEDRQMLLDALMAAADRLVITYTGHDERTNAAQPAAVPVGELLDVVDRTVRVPDRRARDAITVRHPLQPFDPRAFTPGALVGDGPFGFDPVALDGARALAAGRGPRPAFLASPLPPLNDGVVALDELVAFVSHPARAFLAQRLGVRLSGGEDEPSDALPVELDHLARWGVGDRLLAARRAGQELADAVAAERARGTLPPGALGDRELGQVTEAVEAVAAAAAAALGPPGALSSVDVLVDLGDGRTLSGTVAGLDGDRLQAVAFSRVGPKHRLAAWVRLLALTASRPERAWEAVTVGRRRAGGSGRDAVTVARIAPLGADAEARGAAARAELATLVELRDRGLREPPPLACATSAAYAAAVRAGEPPDRAVDRHWHSGYRFPREDAEPEHRLVFGGQLSTEALLAAAPPAPGEEWATEQPSRFGRWSVRLWAGLLAVEETTDR